MTYNKISQWYNLSDDVIVLTGAAGKLGKHYANAFLETDAKVALLDSSQEALDEYQEAFKLLWNIKKALWNT